MVIQINIGDHTGNEFGSVFNQFPTKYLDEVRWARRKALWVSRNSTRGNTYFLGLPAGRSLPNLLADSSIWINYDPSTPFDGYTYSNNNLWIGPPALSKGRWQTLATLIHELAHINGAGGGVAACSTWSVACHAAERAVYECGMGSASETPGGTDDPETPYNPNITG